MPATRLAEIKFSYDWDWGGADEEFSRALALNPNLTIALHRYSHLLVALQRWDESLAVSRRALELDPLDAEMAVHLAFHCYYAGDYDQALAACDAAPAIDSRFHEAFWFRGIAAEAKGLFDEAVQALEQALVLSGGATLERACLGHVFAAMGRHDEARAVLGQLEEESLRRHVSAHNFALVYAGLGETGRAIEQLRMARAQRSNQLPNLAVEPRFAVLWADPSFVALVREMKLSSPSPGRNDLGDSR